jgi:hypothetical protein
MKIKSKRTSNVRRSDVELSENATDRNAIVYEGDEKSSDRLRNNNNDKSNYSNNDYTAIVPLEIDTHFEIYGKHMWEVEYRERCPICNKRIDEYGLCACGSAGD